MRPCARSAALAATAAVVLALAANGAASAVIAVCPDGCAHSSITDALAAAEDGDTVLVRAGTYREGPLVVDKRVSLVGDGWPV
ncbi:MAG TPA: hypothetical protein VF202_09670, partial [Trueperaceae bacterium]